MDEPIFALLAGKPETIWSISPESTVFDAIDMMAEKGIGALLVMAGEKLLGIITERDYARKVILQGRSSKDTRVWEIMTNRIVTVSPTHTVNTCMGIMTQHHIRHLPVLEDGRVVGILSIGDLVRAVISAQEQIIEHLHTYIGAKYPA